MGKGDKRSLRGKIKMGSFGKKRPKRYAKQDFVVADKPQVKEKEVVAEEKKKVPRKTKPKEA